MVNFGLDQQLQQFAVGYAQQEGDVEKSKGLLSYSVVCKRLVCKRLKPFSVLGGLA